ncbi:hypothetical protein BKA70DRAFT_1293343 [Coprinopsis sp. MPI-PUGE-AT-0042]|nr:hypothetical protein BKA70DRAFT_1293343 [Coprinopsis sp. MPI-PUGE-AT-0042]
MRTFLLSLSGVFALLGAFVSAAVTPSQELLMLVEEQSKDELVFIDATCKDLATNCKEMKSKGLCQNTVYRDVMKANCRLTCAYCSPTCRNIGTNCQQMKDHDLCHDKNWRDILKKNCALTCGYCRAYLLPFDPPSEDEF